ncbi:MAG: CotH kinase family protein [Clostridia bacterium]|nr:CotH kinase family protein [Clostridia bacterium]
MKKLFALLIAVITVIGCIPFSVNAAEEHELIGEVQETVPDLRISIDSGYSLDTIHNDKEAKIRTKVSVSGAWEESFNFSSLGAELKTRGNSTFLMPKKPYQIKFDSKTDMFGMGKAKKWILLANYVDGSFVRNKIVLDIANNIGMPYTIKSVFVNLYINGDCKGLYQLCEKVEIGDSRVPLEDDFGLIAEMDAATRLEGEDFYFYTNVTGKPFVYKEYNTDFEDAPAEDVAAVRSFFEERINLLENELYNNGKDWELVQSLIDIDSVIKFYFINEFCMNADACFASTYFYIDGKEDILHMGPAWDYDRCFGYYDYDGGYVQGTEEDFIKNITDCTDKQRVEWYKMFFRYPEFVQRANELYSEVIEKEFDSERIIATIDAYQDLLYDSLMINYVNEGWALFHNNAEAEFFNNRADATEYLNFTTDYLKNNIRKREAYLDSAYGSYHPVLSYQQNGKKTYTGGSMTDASNVASFSVSLDSVIDGSIKYQAFGKNMTVKEGADGSAVSGDQISYVKIYLEGNVANYYSVQYRMYVNGAWTSWKDDGAQCGGRIGFIMSRMQIRLVEKNEIAFGTVRFDCEGVEPVYGIVGNKVALPELPEGVDGWYLDPALTVEADAVTIGEGETVIYSKKGETELFAGDLDGDGFVNAKDANLLKRIVSGAFTPSPAQKKAADVNGDGTVNSVDSNVLVRIAAGTN